MAGGIDQIELVGLAIPGGVHHADGVGLNGDATFPFEVHRVEHLRLHFARGQRSGQLEQSVGQGGFAVVDVRNDGEIAEESGVHGYSGQCVILTGGERVVLRSAVSIPTPGSRFRHLRYDDGVMPFTRIDHVQLAMPAGEEERARAFYRDLLGMEELPKPPELARRGGCWFASGDAQIHLGVEQDFRPARKAHPALRCHDYEVLTKQTARGRN